MTIPQPSTQAINGKTSQTPPNNLPSWSILPHLPATLPKCTIPADVDILEVGTSFLKHFPDLERHHFAPDALWRDTFALTGTIRTFYNDDCIAAAWRKVSTDRQATDFSINAALSRVVRLGQESAWIDVPFTFRVLATPAESCSGFLSLVPDGEGGWRIWVLRTILEQLESQGNVDVLEPKIQMISNGVSNGLSGHSDTKNNTTNGVNGNGNSHVPYFDCVVVGGGQSGLSVGGRLQALGVSYVIIDRIPEVGDSWRLRYESTRLHTTREYAHLPFERTFTSEYQQFLHKDDLARGYKDWVSKYGINIWLSTVLESGSWDEHRNLWCLKLRRAGREHIVSTKHVVFAVGAGSQIPTMPNYPGREKFQGLVIHSADYTSPAEWKGKKGIVIGSANTAHDVAEDMVEAGLSSITMIQRSRTYVLPVEYFHKVSDLIYNPKIPTEWSDRLQFSNPIAVSRLLALRTLHKMANEEPERFDALERAGFQVERYGDIQHHINERLGGHYMDVGCSAKISEGLIKIKSDSPPVSYTRNGLLFKDGTELEADVIVFATGFLGNLREVVGSLLGQDIQDQVQDFWGLNPEGELYGAFKPTGHPGLWYIGGAIGHARYFSRFIALQIKADVMGTPLPLYQDTPFLRELSGVS